MNNTELAIKFSNEKYCTRKDVVDTMKTPLIDSIWNSVLEYRSNFSIILSLKHINNTSYSVCLTPTMVEHVNSVERKLMRLMADYVKMGNYAERDVFKVSSYVKILKCIGNRYGLHLEDAVIENIVNGNVSTLSPDLMILNRYFQCLKEIENNPSTKIDDDSLSRFYSLLMGTNELTEYYRTQEVDNSLSKVVIGRLYLGVPVNTIEANMDQLFNFLQNSHVSMFIKAISAFYFTYYVKPFESYTEEMAILTLKKVLASNDIGSVAAFLNFEDLVSNKDELESFILESQKTFDLTYIIDYVLRKSEVYLDNVLNSVVEAQKTVINKEINQPEETNILNSTPSVSNSDEKSFNNINGAIENKPNFVQQNVPFRGAVDYSQSIAISNLPTGLSEEEASRLENHLMELNPNLSHGQAYFYARHCTLGMNYTISQYKKTLGCAYETARTSMDQLVFLGYYRKEVLKNKFIYTPVKKG
jgi:hypothetical protein